MYEEKNIAVDVLTQRNKSLSQELTLEEIFLSFSQRGEINIKDTVLKSFGFESLSDNCNDENLHATRKLIAHTYDEISKILSDKAQLVSQYLLQEGALDKPNMQIVDVGWRGSIQHSISLITNHKTTGYYFGTIESTYPDIMSKSFGWALDLGVPYNLRKLIIDNIMMYEILFSAPHGTLLDLKRSGNGVIPVLDEESEHQSKCITEFQSAAIEEVQKLEKYMVYLDVINPATVLSVYNKFLEDKPYDAVVEFSKLSNNIGYSVKKKSYVKVFEKEDFINNPVKVRELIDKSMWKGAFLVNGLSPDEIRKYFKKMSITSGQIYDGRKLKDYFFKSLKNPKKAFYVVKNKLRSRLKYYINR